MNKLNKTSFMISIIFSVSILSPVFSTPVYAETIQPDSNFTIQFDDSPIFYDTPVIFSDLDISDFLFYDQLDENNKATYDALYPLCETPSVDAISISLPESISLQVSSRNMNNWTEEETSTYYTSLIHSTVSGIVSLSLDEPMLFWLNIQDTQITPVDMNIKRNIFFGTYTLTISSIAVKLGYDKNYNSIDDVLEKKQELDKVISEFVIEGETDAEKCAYIHDTLVEQITYDETAAFSGSIAGSMLDPYHAVCEGYSEAFKVLCDRENIPCISVIGNYNRTASTAHMWNYVMLDGQWYGVDTTWDDSTSLRKFFLRGSEYFLSNHTPESIYDDVALVFPELSVNDYYSETTTTTESSVTTVTTTFTETTTTEITTTENTTAETTTTKTATTENTTAETTTTETPTTENTTAETTTTETTTTENTTAETTTTEIATTENTTAEMTTTKIATTENTTAEMTTIETTTTENTTTEIKYIIGDVNLDGECNLSDYIYLRKFLIGYEDVKGNFYMDLNKDGNVNIFDASLWIALCI